MEEREFLAMADAELARLDEALDALQDEADFDYELKPGGIIEIAFANGSKIIVNRHAAAQEIWVAARSGGYHFKPPAAAAEPWRDTRSGEALPATLARCFSEQAGAALRLDW